MERVIKGGLSGIMAAVTAYCGKIFVPFVVMLGVMIIDYITGVVKAAYSKEITSKTHLKGVVKKFFCIILVVVAGVLDWFVVFGAKEIGLELELKYYIGLIVCLWLIINELISILENIREFIPLPQFLNNLVAMLKSETEGKL